MSLASKETFQEKINLLLRATRAERFRFIIIQSDLDIVRSEIERQLSLSYPDRPLRSFWMDSMEPQVFFKSVFYNPSGFFLLDRFSFLLKKEDFTFSFNQRRDRLARHPIQFIVFIPSDQKYLLELSRKMPDMWSLRNLILIFDDDYSDIFPSVRDHTLISQMKINKERITYKNPELSHKVDEILERSQSVADKNPSLAANLLLQALKLMRKSGTYTVENSPNISEFLKKHISPDLMEYNQILLEYAKFLTDIGEQKKAEQIYKELLDKVDDHKDLKLHSEILLEYAMLYDDLGNYEKARSLLETSIKLREELVQLNPNSADYKKGLAISYSRLSQIYQNLGKSENAKKFSLMEVKLFEELDQLNPHSADYKKGLAISYLFLGEIYEEQGNFQLALEFFLKDLKISEELVQLNPKSTDYKQLLAISYSKLGNIYEEQGNFQLALEFFLKYNKLREELVQLNPQSADYKNGLAISYSKLGDIYQEQGNFQLALEFLLKEVDLLEELVQLNPDSAKYKIGQAITYLNLGEIYQIQGNSQLALESFLNEVKLFEELVQLNPQSVEYKNELAFSLDNLAGITPKEQAIYYYRQAEQAWQELYELTGDSKFKEYMEIARKNIWDLG